MVNKLEYETVWLPVTALSVVWVKSQRPFREKWAKDLAADFDDAKFEPVIVTKPNGAGIYHIVEGQHRKAAVELAFGLDQQVPCRIIEEADPARAAEIFLGINKGRKPIRPVVEFLVAVEAKRETEVAINTIVRRAGYHVGDNMKGDNNIIAVGALRRVYVLGEKTLIHTLEATRLLWGNDPNGTKANMLTGIGRFMNEFHEYVDPRRLRTTIHTKYSSPWKFLDAARTLKEKASESMDFAVAELMRVTYNKQLPDSRKLRRKESR